MILTDMNKKRNSTPYADSTAKTQQAAQTAYQPAAAKTQAEDYAQRLKEQQSRQAVQTTQPRKNTTLNIVAAPGQTQAAANMTGAGTPMNGAHTYFQALQNLENSLLNPQQFNYEFNGDNLFKYYSDLYTQKGKQASMDAMGQAAALTGGYGNTYAQQVGQQAYQQNLQNLYDVGLQLEQDAYGKYADDLNRQLNMYGQMANNELNWAQLNQAQAQYEQNMAASYVTSMLANGQMPSAALLAAAGLTEADARKLLQQVQSGGGGRPSKDSDKTQNKILSTVGATVGSALANAMGNISAAGNAAGNAAANGAAAAVPNGLNNPTKKPQKNTPWVNMTK